MTPTPFEASLVLGLINPAHVPAFYAHLLNAVRVARPAQRDALATAFPGLVVAWVMNTGGSDYEVELLKKIASQYAQ